MTVIISDDSGHRRGRPGGPGPPGAGPGGGPGRCTRRHESRVAVTVPGPIWIVTARLPVTGAGLTGSLPGAPGLASRPARAGGRASRAHPDRLATYRDSG